VVARKPHQVPDLIGVLRELVTSQYVEADRAICGLGEFMLTPDYAKHRITADCWKQMSADQRRKASDKCFRQMPSVVVDDGRHRRGADNVRRWQEATPVQAPACGEVNHSHQEAIRHCSQ